MNPAVPTAMERAIVTATLFDVTIGHIRHEAIDVVSFELLPSAGADLPAFTAGAHIDVHLPGEMIRSYSLCNDQAERHRYVIAIRKEAAGRGASLHMHERLSSGDKLTISPPRNHFPLVEDGSPIVFIAGGIGITPVWGMIQRLQALGLGWTLHYCARTPQHAAFYDSLAPFQTGVTSRVHFHFDNGVVDQMVNVGSLIAQSPSDAHLYCCGPTGMMDAFRAASAVRPAQQVHTEYFSGATLDKPQGGFEVELARSGLTLSIAQDQSILDALIAAGLDAPYSCKEGVCGNCETTVIAGTPEHRDLVLTAEERTSGRTMMICCSGCVGDRLVLDL
jgi:vanillate O-demethylase ferredoxin subunit